MRKRNVIALREQMEKTLQKTPSKVLKSLIQNYAQHNSEFRDVLLQKLYPYNPYALPAAQHYPRLIQKLTKPFVQKNKVADRHAHNYLAALHQLLAEDEPSTSPDHIERCFALLKHLLNTQIDTTPEAISELAKVIGTQLHQSFQTLTTEEQQAIFIRLSEFTSNITHHQDSLLPVLLDLITAWAHQHTEWQQANLEYIDHKLQSCGKNKNWQQNRLLERKAELLSRWGRDEDIRLLADQHLAIPDFREQLVKVFIQEQDYNTAQAMLYRGIELAQQDKKLIQRWQKYLLIITEKTDNITDKRALLNQALQSLPNKLPYYQALKASYAPEAWATQRTPLLRKLANDYGKAEILASEEDSASLYDCLMQSSIDGEKILRNYIDLLSSYKPESINHIFKEMILSQLKQANKKVYQQAIEDIKILQSLPESQDTSQQLLTHIKAQYTKRPALIRLINQNFKED